MRTSDGYRTAVGGVQIGKRHVCGQLIPRHVHPDPLERMSSALRRSMQGKSRFNFERADPDLRAELAALVRLCAAPFASDGRLKPDT